MALKDSLVAHFSFDGTIASDVGNYTTVGWVGNPYTSGTLSGSGAHYVAGLIGQAWSYQPEGVIISQWRGNSRVDISPSINLGTSWTISAWLNFTGDSGATNPVLTDALTNSGMLAAYNQKVCITAGEAVKSLTSLTTGWHHSVITYNNGTGSYYLDGVYDGPTSTPVSPLSINRVGSANWNADPTTRKFDLIGLWTRAITAAEVTTLYNGGAGLSYNGISGVFLDSLLVYNNGTLQKIDSSSSISLSSNLTIGGAAVALEQTIVSDNSGNLNIPFGSSTNFYHQLTENITLTASTSASYGQSGIIIIKQHSSSVKTVSSTSDFMFASGSVFSMSSGTGSISVISYYYSSAGKYLCVFSGDFR